MAWVTITSIQVITLLQELSFFVIHYTDFMSLVLRKIDVSSKQATNGLFSPSFEESKSGFFYSNSE